MALKLKASLHTYCINPLNLTVSMDLSLKSGDLNIPNFIRTRVRHHIMDGSRGCGLTMFQDFVSNDFFAILHKSQYQSSELNRFENLTSLLLRWW